MSDQSVEQLQRTHDHCTPDICESKWLLTQLAEAQERERVLVAALRPFVDRWMKFAGPRVEALDVLLPAEWIRQAAAALPEVGVLEER